MTRGNDPTDRAPGDRCPADRTAVLRRAGESPEAIICFAAADYLHALDDASL